MVQFLMAKKTIRGADIDWSREYAVIGEYVVCFESVVALIRTQAEYILYVNGLKAHRLASIIFNYRHMTADPLLDNFCYLVQECVEHKPGGQTVLAELSKFKKAFTEQIKRRNKIMHSDYAIGDTIHYLWDDNLPLPGLFATKGRSSKDKAFEVEKTVKSIEHLKGDIRELRSLWEQFGNLIKEIHPLLQLAK